MLANESFRMSSNTFRRKCALALFAIVIVLSLPGICHSHGHSHEKASFKYSREANEDLQGSQKPHQFQNKDSLKDQGKTLHIASIIYG